MSTPHNNHDLFSASLESLETSKRVEKFKRFKADFQRECNATLDNAQEWIKAELPIVTDYIDAPAIKDELKQPKTSKRRKHLLSALLFEKSLRESIENNNASCAAIMAMHMFNHMWQAKVELNSSLPTAVASSSSTSPSQSAIETYNDTREKILTTLIEKGEKLKKDSQIQPQAKPIAHNITPKKPTPAKPQPAAKTSIASKPSYGSQKKADLWVQEAEKAKQQKRFANLQTKKPKKKSNGVLSKVKTRLPLTRRGKAKAEQELADQKNKIAESKPDDSLLDNPNRSAIMVNPGFSDSIDDSLIQERKQFPSDPNESGVTVHKILKERDHARQEPGSNTIIMKLASSSGKRSSGKLSVPEQCQQAINILTEQFPGYDMVAIRHMAAEKVGVSPQYIENLNILPEHM